MKSDSPFRFDEAAKPWPFLASAVLHGLLLAALATWTFASDSPFGVPRRGDPTLIDILGAPSRPASPVVHAAAKSAPAVVSASASAAPKTAETPEAAAPAVAAPASGFGLREGTAETGELGRPDGSAASVKDRYLYELRILIEGRQTYPLASRRLKERGKVTVQFTVARDGSIGGVSLKNSSAYPRLDQAALELVAGLGRYKPLPAEVGGDRLVIELPIEYVLR